MFLRSRAKSTSPGEPIAMENSMGTGSTQLNIYDNSKGFDDSVVGGNTNTGYHMEIQDDTLDGKVNDGQVSESRDGHTTKHEDNVRQKDSPTHDNCVVGEAPNLNSAYKYALKPISFVKAGDETITMDNHIYPRAAIVLWRTISMW